MLKVLYSNILANNNNNNNNNDDDNVVDDIFYECYIIFHILRICNNLKQG